MFWTDLSIGPEIFVGNSAWDKNFMERLSMGQELCGPTQQWEMELFWTDSILPKND